MMLSAALVCLAAVAPVSATEDSLGVDTTAIVDSVLSDTIVSPSIDTLLFVPSRDVSRAADVTNPVSLEDHLYQKPTVALVKSMLVPGLGQLGNRRYVKALFFAGLESWLIASTLHHGSLANDAREAYLAADDLSIRRSHYYDYDAKRKNRNKYAWFAGLTIFISMFDAYVDAHLSGSPADSRNDDVSLDLKPTDNGGVAAQLTFRF